MVFRSPHRRMATYHRVTATYLPPIPSPRALGFASVGFIGIPFSQCIAWFNGHWISDLHVFPPAKLSTFSVEGSNMVKYGQIIISILLMKSTLQGCSKHRRNQRGKLSKYRGKMTHSPPPKWLSFICFFMFFSALSEKNGSPFWAPQIPTDSNGSSPIRNGATCLHRLGAFGSFSLARATVRLRLPEACNPRRGAVGFVGWTSGWIQWYSYIDRIMIG